MYIDLMYGTEMTFEGDSGAETLPLMVQGLSCRAGYLPKKHFIIPDTELTNIAKTLSAGVDGNGAYILKDHGVQSMWDYQSVDKLVGRVVMGTKRGREVFYKGRIEDEDIAHKIRTKLVTSSSVGLRVEELYCSICNRSYGDPDCNHRLGKEYADEGLHEKYKSYLPEMDGKPLAAIVGKKIQAREQSVILFPAIKGSSIGLNFSEDSEKFLNDVEKLKIEGSTNSNDNLGLSEEEIIKKLKNFIEGFNKDLTIISGDQQMTNEVLEKLTEDLADEKAENKVLLAKNISLIDDKKTAEDAKETAEQERDAVKVELADEKEKLKTAEELIEKFKGEDMARAKAVKDALIEELLEMRKTRGLPEKDYSELSMDVVKNAHDLLKELPESGSSQGSVGEGGDDAVEVLAKENIREVIFKKRRDEAKITGLKMKDLVK